MTTEQDEITTTHESTIVSRALVQVEHYRRLWTAAQMQLGDAIAHAEAAPGFDGAPPEIIDVPHPDRQDNVTIKRNQREHPLDLMHAKGQIPPLLYQAGDRLRCDLEAAHISPIRTAQLDSIYLHTGAKAAARGKARVAVRAEDIPALFPKTISTPDRVWRDLQPFKLDALDRVNRALRAVETAVGVIYEPLAQRGRRAGSDPARGKDAVVVLMMVLRDRALVRDLEAMIKWGKQDNIRKKYLRPALEALADHYGLSVRARSGKIRSMRAPDDESNRGVKPERTSP